MTSQLSGQLSRPQLFSIAATWLAIGVTWTAVVVYRLQVKGIDGEWGNLAFASVGLGFGCATVCVAFLRRARLWAWLAIGAALSGILLVAFAYLFNVL